jgi:hypothetical protein
VLSETDPPSFLKFEVSSVPETPQKRTNPDDVRRGFRVLGFYLLGERSGLIDDGSGAYTAKSRMHCQPSAAWTSFWRAIKFAISAQSGIILRGTEHTCQSDRGPLVAGVLGAS